MLRFIPKIPDTTAPEDITRAPKTYVNDGNNGNNLPMFLPDPGKPGVRSMGPDVRLSERFLKLNLVDSG